MATNTWSSASSTDGNAAGNWSLGHAPQSDDDLVFSNTSVVNCTFTATVNVNSITIASTYSGNFSQGGQTITAATSILIDGTGTRTFNNTITITGDGDFHIGSTVGTLTLTAVDLDLRGTGNLDVDKTLNLTTINFRNVTCAYNGKTTTISGGVTFMVMGVLTCNSSGGTLTLNQITQLGNSGTVEPFVTNGAIINGTQILYFIPQNTATITISAITMTNGIIINDCASKTVTYNMSGAVSAGSIQFINIGSTASTVIFNTNNYAITSAATMPTTLTTGTATCSWTFNYNASTVTIGSTFVCTKDTGATLAINVTTGHWYIGTSMTLVASGTAPATYDWGTSTMTGTAAGTTTCAGCTFYNWESTGGVRAFADAVIMNTFVSSGTGGINCSSTCTIDKSMLHDGSGAMSFQAALTITTGVVSSDVFRNTASSGTCMMAACTFTISGNGYINLGKTVIMMNLVVAASGKTVVNNSTVAITIAGSSPDGVLTTSTGTFTSNGAIAITQSTCANPLVIGAGTFNGTGALSITYTATTSFNIPAITYTGSGALTIQALSPSGTLTITMTGALNWSAPVTITQNRGTVGVTTTFNTDNYAITCTSLSLGNQNAAANTVTYNWGSSAVSCSTLIAIGNAAGTTNMVMGTSAWTCGDSWTWGTNWTVTLNSFTLTITGTGTITGVVKNFYNLILNASGGTITFATGNCTIQSLKVEPGTTVEFFAAMTYTITTNSANMWDGSAGNRVKLKSTTWGTAYNLTMTAGAHTVLYVAASDCNSDSAVTATGGSNVNSGNNTKWTFDSKFWIGGASGATTDWENANNWAATSGGTAGAGKPTATEDAIFDSNSTGYSCVLTASVVAGSILFTTAWNKTFGMAGFNITSTGFITIDGTASSAWTHNGLITITSGGSYTVNTGIATMTLTNADVDIKQYGALALAETTGAAKALRNITFGYSGYSNFVTGATTYFTGVVTCGGGGITTTFGLRWVGSGTTEPFIWNGSVITGNATNGIFYNPQGASTVTIGATSGTIYMDFWDVTGQTVTYNQTNTIICATFTVTNVSNSTGLTVWNTNDNTINLATGTGNINITLTTGTSLCTVTFNFGASLIYITGNSFNVTTDVGATCNLNLGSSVWYIRLDWTVTSQCVVNAGTSTVNFTSINTVGGASPTIISAGNSFYNVNIHLTSNSYTLDLADNFVCNTLTHDLGAFGNFTAGGFSITAASSVNFNSTGTLNLSAVTITGNGDFSIASTVGVCTLTNANIEMQGTGNFDIDKTGLTFVSVKFNADGKTIQSTGSAAWTTGRLYLEPGTTAKFKEGITVTISSYTSGDWDGSAGKLVTIKSITDTQTHTLANPAGMSVSYISVRDSIATNDITADANCINGGNNTKWIFGGAATAIWFLLAMKNQLAYTNQF